MKNRLWIAAGTVSVGITAFAFAQESATTQPVPKALPADQLLERMLDTNAPQGQPLQPVTTGGNDAGSGGGALAPGSPLVPVIREGSYIVDRTGRLTKSADGQSVEFAFDSDGTAQQDPPMVILPNLKLMQMEQASENSSRELLFRITGMVTEYRGRNYVLIEKAVVSPGN